MRVVDFGAIREADIELGPGLNVLYGPNDLGKSTLANSIRMGLLLPNTSSHIGDYVPWTGGRDPVIELTFETEPQRIWRVKKEFRKGGTALLEESRDGVSFADVERARKVDGKLRELLCWGIPEPGGAGGSKGVPTSFLATVLLSTQDDVSSVLYHGLEDDPSSTGKERIAAALQAVAQDPLFVSLLRATQARRDEGYTDKGAKKTAKGSVFKAAADRLNQCRSEKEALQRLVDDSEGVEQQLRELMAKRGRREEAVATTTERLTKLEQLAAQAAALAVATEQLRLAHDEVRRIQTLVSQVQEAERTVEELAQKLMAAEEALRLAQRQQKEADAAFQSAEDAERTAGQDPAVSDTVIRQVIELRKVAADVAARDAQQNIDGAMAAQLLVDAATAAEHDRQAQLVASGSAHTALSDAAASERSAQERLDRLGLLEHGLEVRAADEQVALAHADVKNEAELRARREARRADRLILVERRRAITVPNAAALVSMRRLASELAGARGALSVGLVVTVTPIRPVDVRVKIDGTATESALSGQVLEVEAKSEVDVELGGVASLRVRGGNREAQRTAEALETRWTNEVVPHLVAAAVADLESLSAKVTEAQELDTMVKAKDAELTTLEAQILALANASPRLRDALDRQQTSITALGELPLATLEADIAALGTDAASTLRSRRQQASKDLDKAREWASNAGTSHVLAEERARMAHSALEAALSSREVAVAAFPEGVSAGLAAARTALAAASDEQRKTAIELSSLDRTMAAEAERVEAAVRGARAAAGQARARLEVATLAHTSALTEHASQAGQLSALRGVRDAQDLTAAEKRLLDATSRHAAVPVPEQIVTVVEVVAAQTARTTATSDLKGIDIDIQRTQGALEQVGGAVARERLRDATEAYELADRQDREVEANYEAWRLLLEQMKEADAAQASNLGQVLAPAIAGRFQALTQRRYENLQLDAQLGTEGVVVAGMLRSTERISVGTREQLSTLYRLALAEYLSTTVVLDDQLVQSDDTRMDWFRAMLSEKAHSFQIVVFTCRPGDYLAANAMVRDGSACHADTNDGFTRAVDLARAVRGG